MSRHNCVTPEASNFARPVPWARRSADQAASSATSGPLQRSAVSRFEQRGQATLRAMVATVLSCGLLGSAVFAHMNAAKADAPGYSLASIPVPGPPPEVLAEFIADEAAAIQLGKALFWEMRVGSDNKTACASCHFHAGADNRVPNQLNPGMIGGDTTFQLGSINHWLQANEFPFTRHSSVDSTDLQIWDVNEIAGSQGAFFAAFSGVGTKGAIDKCDNIVDPVFHGTSANGGVNTRQATGRNSPSAINAVFNFRNFWDGRGNNMFNGADPFGMRNPNALVWRMEGKTLRRVKVAIPSASLASQGVGPPLSGVEMSCSGRSFMKLGKKLLPLVPLSGQTIAKDDSVLRSGGAESLRRTEETYAGLVRKAFRKPYWASPAILSLSEVDEMRVASMDVPAPRPFKRKKGQFDVSQMEANFALFFGLAIHMYESTLISGDTPFDRYLDGDASALTEQQIRGFNVFAEEGKCINCHGGVELTNASFANVINQRIERMLMGDNNEAVYDNGFYNIGVRPTAEDLGVGGTDPFGNPLSETRMVQAGKAGLLGNSFDRDKEPSVGANDRVAVDGAFKTPGLRNVEFTGPYFHNGGQSTLMQVVDFYNRGGDFAAANRDNLDPDIQPLGLTEPQKQDLVAFMLALSDDRVRYSKAPFDHPSLCIPNGHQAVAGLIADGTTGNATDGMRCLEAVGAGGSKNGLATFLELSPFER